MSDTLQFFTLPGAWGNLSASPFCGKLQTWMTLAGIDFKIRTANLPKAPNGKAPYIEFQGQTIGDSSKIIAHLQTTLGIDLDGHLTDAQRAMGHLVKRTCEEHLYWAVVYQRWFRDEGFAHTRKLLDGLAPAILLPIVRKVARGKAIKQVKGHGLGLHPEPRVCALAAEDLAALAAVLGDGPYLFGERPSSFDASLYAFTSSALRIAHPNGVTDAIKQHANLLAYIERMDAKLGHDPSA